MIRLSISAMLIFKSIPTQPNTCRSTTLVATLTSPHLSPAAASLFIAQRSRISKPLSARPPTSPIVVVFLSRYSSAHASSSTNRHSSQSIPAQVPAICCSTVPRSKGLPPTPWCNTTRATMGKCCTSLTKNSQQVTVLSLQSAVFSQQSAVSSQQSAGFSQQASVFSRQSSVGSSQSAVCDCKSSLNSRHALCATRHAPCALRPAYSGFNKKCLRHLLAKELNNQYKYRNIYRK